MTVYHRAAFDAALTKLCEDPKSLTDSDIEQFAIVNPKIADHARARRQNLVPAETERERKFLDRPTTHRDVLGTLENHLFPILAAQRYEREQLEARVADLQSTLNLAGKELDGARSQINYLLWQREQEAEKVPR